MGYQIQFLGFFSKTPIPSDLNPKKRFWWHIFLHIGGSIGPIVFKNNRVHPWVDFVIRDPQNKKHDHSHLLHSPISEIKGVRIVVISFQNITKKL